MNPLLTCAIMVKNEEPRILRTMSTALKYVDSFVILDTGSTDRTKEVARTYCEIHKKKFYLYEEPFVNFEVSRNSLLDKCFGKSEFVLLMDANDELRDAEVLPSFLESRREFTKEVVFLIRFELDNDMRPGAKATYSRICIIRNNTPDVRYDMPVHERIICKTPNKFVNNIALMNTKLHMFQDRALDKPSTERYKKDFQILKEYGEKRGFEPRIYHYICQTCANMDDFENLKIYAQKLVEYDKPGKIHGNGQNYIEYIFYAYMHLGTSCYKLEPEKKEWIKWFLKAYEYSKRKYERCEPLFILSLYHMLANDLDVAKMYIEKACGIRKPDGMANMETQIDSNIYDNLRHKLKEHINELIRQQKINPSNIIKLDEDKFRNNSSNIQEVNGNKIIMVE